MTRESSAHIATKASVVEFLERFGYIAQPEFSVHGASRRGHPYRLDVAVPGIGLGVEVWASESARSGSEQRRGDLRQVGWVFANLTAESDGQLTADHRDLLADMVSLAESRPAPLIPRCRKGHPPTDENTMLRSGMIRCRLCWLQSGRKWSAAHHRVTADAVTREQMRAWGMVHSVGRTNKTEFHFGGEWSGHLGPDVASEELEDWDLAPMLAVHRQERDAAGLPAMVGDDEGPSLWERFARLLAEELVLDVETGELKDVRLRPRKVSP